MSTAGATDSQAHRLVVSEPGGTEAADPARGCTPSDSASSSDSGSSGNTPPAVQDRTSGDADASADPPPLSPAPAAVAGREAADAHAEGVAVATAAETACDTDVELRRRLGELRSAAARLGAVSAGSAHHRASRPRAVWSRLWWRRWSGVWRRGWKSRQCLPACRRTWCAGWMRT